MFRFFLRSVWLSWLARCYCWGCWGSPRLRRWGGRPCCQTAGNGGQGLGAAFHGVVGHGLPNSRERWSRAGGCLSWGGRPWAAKRRGTVVKGRGLSQESGEGGYGGGYKKRSRHGRRVLNAWFGVMQRGLCQPLGSVRSRFRNRCRTRRSYGGSCRYLLCWQHPDRLRRPGWQSARR